MPFQSVDGFAGPGDRLLAALDASSVVGVWEWDHQRKIGIFDRGAAGALTGDPNLAERELPGDKALAAVHPDDREWLERRTRELVRTGNLFVAEYRVVTGDGAVRWMLSRGRTYRTASGEPLHTRGILIDITESRVSDDRYIVEVREPAQDALEQAVDHAIAIKELLAGRETKDSRTLRLVADMLLLQLGREVAREPDPDA